MAKNSLNLIFLSASIPSKERHRKYFDTADLIAIRDSIRALATVVIPKSKLIWGGHPAITPLIRYVMGRMNSNLKDHITLYQSNFFKHLFPPDNLFFENVEIVPENRDLESSLADMRNAMIRNNDFKVGIFIGGMEGVELEYKLFKESHPGALVLPVASTGAAAKIIYNSMEKKPDHRLQDDYAYMALFRSLLEDFIQ